MYTHTCTYTQMYTHTCTYTQMYTNTWILHQYGSTVTGWCSNEDIMVSV